MEMANTRTPSASARSIRKVAAVSLRTRSPNRRSHQFIRGKQLAPEVRGQEQHGDGDARQQVSQHQLQKSEVSLKRQRRRPNHRQCAGFRRYDGQSDGPPGSGSAAQKIVLERFLRTAKARSEPGDPGQICGDDCQVDPTHAVTVQDTRPPLRPGRALARGNHSPPDGIYSIRVEIKAGKLCLL